VLSPVVGEYFALHALAADRATSDATAWATIGVSTTGAYLLAPFVWRILFGVWVGVVMLPVGVVVMAIYSIALVLQGTMELVKLVYRRLGHSSPEDSDPARTAEEHES
jgi:uncharacterized membrane protein YccF (DUF307 family)